MAHLMMPNTGSGVQGVELPAFGRRQSMCHRFQRRRVLRGRRRAGEFQER